MASQPGHLQMNTPAERHADGLAVSVVIPTRNRPDRLQRCLAALATQTLARHRFEVIIVDDGSDMSLEPIVERARDRLTLRLIVVKNGGPARARNLGAEQATARLLAFTDDDCEPEPEWLERLVARFAEDHGAAFGGHTVNALPDNPYSTASQLLVDYLYDYYGRIGIAGGTAAPPFFTSNNFAVSAELFRLVGRFDESFPLAAGEDRELCDRWQHRGYRLRRVHDAVVRHAHALTLRRYLRQHMNYGRGAFHLRRARIANGRTALRREPLSFYYGLVTYPLNRPELRGTTKLVLLMLLSQLANILGFALEARKQRERLSGAPSTH